MAKSYNREVVRYEQISAQIIGALTTGDDVLNIVPLLKKLVEVHAPSGYEEAIRPIMIEELQNYVNEIYVDPLGNVIGQKYGRTNDGPKVMISAHMDEVGLIVKHINDEGFIFFEKNGMIDDRILLARMIRVHARKGSVKGVIGVKAKHLLKPEEMALPLSFRDMWIDVGAHNRSEVEELGVTPSDPITFDGDIQIIGKGNIVMGRALDNRLGCTALIETMKKLGNKEHEATIYAVASVMEEVGARGARTAASAINPDIALALDTTHGIDLGVTPAQSAIKLGNGPSIRLMDIYWPTLQGCITPTWLKDLMLGAANEESLPYQIDILSGTFLDSSTISLVGHGVPSVGVLMPRRNGHTPVEVASLNDLENSVRLVLAFVRRLNKEVVTGYQRRIK